MSNATKALEAMADLLEPVMARKRAQRMGTSWKHDLSSVSLRTEYSHGPGGQLSWPGVDPVLFNASMGVESLLSRIPTSESLYTDPTYAILTGVTGDSGNEKVNPCDDAPVAGLMKSCITHAVFGRYERATDQIELNRLGQRTDRADPMDLTLVGSPLGDSGIFGQADPATPGDILENEVSRLFWERNTSFFRLLAGQLWLGNPTNNSAGLGYKELTGLQSLVRTGYIDAISGTACPAVDSYVRNFGYFRVDTNGGNLVAEITNVWYQLRYRARRMQLMPVRWVIAMREQLFNAITEVWPCAYMTFRCQTSAGNEGFVDAAKMVEMRDEMRQGSYLVIDGQRVEVVFDDSIPELDGNDSGGNFPAGCFSSDIYFLPMSVVGGRSTLYLEYFSYNNPEIRDTLGKMVLGEIEGAFITWPRQTNLCVQWQSKIEPRLVLRTPYLASRLQNVVYCPIEHVRDPFPGESYFVNGGQTSRPGPSYNELWNN